MKRILFVTLIFVPVVLKAQVFTDYTPDVSEKAVKSIEYIASSVISDAFTPMTWFTNGEDVYTAAPALFTADPLNSDPEIKSDNFKGAALGAGWGRALSDSTIVYFIAAGMAMKGDMEMKTYGDSYGALGNSTDFNLLHVTTGAGHAFYTNEFVSLLAYAGLHAQYYSAEIKTDPVTWTSYTVNNTTSGSGLLYGISGCAAFSFKIAGSFIATPYILYMRNFNSASMKADLELSGALPLSGSEKLDLTPVSAWMTGLSLGFKNDEGFTFSLSVGSLISSLTGYGSKASGGGLELKSLVLVFSYNTGN